MSLFLGAGASARWIPDTVGMVEGFLYTMEAEARDVPDEDVHKEMTETVRDLKAILSSVENLGFRADIESLLSIAESLSDPQSVPQRLGPVYGLLATSREGVLQNLPKNSLLRDREIARRVLFWVKNDIAVRCSIRSKDTLSEVVEHYQRFFDSIGTVVSTEGYKVRLPILDGYIFTTNYDWLIEAYFNANKLPLINGVIAGSSGIPTFDPAAFEIADKEKRFGTRLVKLHGSVDLARMKDGRIVWRYPIFGETYQERESVFYGGRYGDEDPYLLAEELMLYPTETRDTFRSPFFDLFRIFRNRLLESDVCLIVGYSFRDRDVNQILQDAISNGLKIVLIDPNGDKNFPWRKKSGVKIISKKIEDQSVPEELREIMKSGKI